MSDVRRSSNTQYPTLKAQDIIDLNQFLSPLLDPDAVLALWVVGSQLQLGMDVLAAWGFQQKQVTVWVKTRVEWDSGRPLVSNLAFGMGRLFRQSHELCLIGTRGKVYAGLQNRSQRSVLLAPALKHSAKPEDLQDSLELMFPAARKLELFARRGRPGWTCLGDEIDGQDIRDALHALRPAVSRA